LLFIDSRTANPARAWELAKQLVSSHAGAQLAKVLASTPLATAEPVQERTRAGRAGTIHQSLVTNHYFLTAASGEDAELGVASVSLWA